MQDITNNLLENKVASRIFAQDSSLYDFDENSLEFAKNYMGWSDLASRPPVDINEIAAFAKERKRAGLNAVYLIGMGGSSQAPMTVTKFNKFYSSNKNENDGVKFRVLDSTSPVRLRKALLGETFEHAIVVVSSKSGGTLEPRMILSAVRDIMAKHLSDAEISRHLVAITDAGSALERQAKEENWLKVFIGKDSVGGRFSALSVFGLVPSALAGVDIEKFMSCASIAERDCSRDSKDNPAIKLAAFLYGNYMARRDKFCYMSSKSGRTLGLWIEQLVAESLGKGGVGIVPCLEVNPSLQAFNQDRTFIVYKTSCDTHDEKLDFEESVRGLSEDVPQLNYEIQSVCDLAKYFVMWEYAVAMCGYLMRVCPFDQPDVQSAKTKVVDIIESGLDVPTFKHEGIELRVSPALGFQCGGDEHSAHNTRDEHNAHVANDAHDAHNAQASRDAHDLHNAHLAHNVQVVQDEQSNNANVLREVLGTLVNSIEPSDYFALNAFLPFEGVGRVHALEHMRSAVAQHTGVVSLLEIAPRFLHSSGQLHKGGPNNGVFLIVSGDEMDDIKINEKCKTLGSLAKAQAVGDWQVLAERNRRAVQLHLPSNSSSELWKLAYILDDVLCKKL